MCSFSSRLRLMLVITFRSKISTIFFDRLTYRNYRNFYVYKPRTDSDDT